MTSFAHTHAAAGQDHDRFAHDESLSLPSMLPTEGDMDGTSDPLEITAFQKMLSATTGSLLTGLLGMKNPTTVAKAVPF